MLHNSVRQTISVIVCSYTEERFDLLLRVIDSLKVQTLLPDEVVVVVDHNVSLYRRLAGSLQDVTVVESTGPQGLSGARNTGFELTCSDILVFLDDDAEASPDWLERLTPFYDDDDVLAVGGGVQPLWEDGRPPYFGEELDWIVGCSYRGLPKVAAEVRNMIGANMSFRREVLQQVGGFSLALGRQGAKPLGCEETEICIRASIGAPGSRIVYEPAAVVFHHVPAGRGKLRYMLTRAWFEGVSKAQVSTVVGQKRALRQERRYVRSVLPKAVIGGVLGWAKGSDRFGFSRAGAIIAVLAVTTAGYLRGRQQAHTARPHYVLRNRQIARWRVVK